MLRVIVKWTENMLQNQQIFDHNLQIFLQREDDAKKHKLGVTVKGWHQHLFLVTTAPFFNGKAMLWPSGTSVTVKLINNGQIYSFSASVISTLSTPSPLYILSYPDVIENMTRRTYERIQTYIACQIETTGDDNFGGTILNLSRSGAFIRIHGSPIFNQGDTLYLSTTLPNGSAITKIKVSVENIKSDTEHYELGVSFDNSSQDAQDIINFFSLHIKDNNFR